MSVIILMGRKTQIKKKKKIPGPLKYVVRGRKTQTHPSKSLALFSGCTYTYEDSATTQTEGLVSFFFFMSKPHCMFFFSILVSNFNTRFSHSSSVGVHVGDHGS